LTTSAATRQKRANVTKIKAAASFDIITTPPSAVTTEPSGRFMDPIPEDEERIVIPDTPQTPLTEAELFPTLKLGPGELAFGLSGCSVGFAIGMVIAYSICVGR
jgi:hypothetical protein